MLLDLWFHQSGPTKNCYAALFDMAFLPFQHHYSSPIWCPEYRTLVEDDGFSEFDSLEDFAMKIWEGGQQIDVPGARLFDQASDTTLYVGEAKVGTGASFNGWQIKRITFSASGHPIALRWANKGEPVSKWDDRASLGYE